MLNKSSPSPFIKDPNFNDDNNKKDNKDKTKEEKINTIIDFEGIKDRITNIPISESILDSSIGFSENKIFYLQWPINNSREIPNNPYKGTLKFYDLKNLEEKVFVLVNMMATPTPLELTSPFI